MWPTCNCKSAGGISPPALAVRPFMALFDPMETYGGWPARRPAGRRRESGLRLMAPWPRWSRAQTLPTQCLYSIYRRAAAEVHSMAAFGVSILSTIQEGRESAGNSPRTSGAVSTATAESLSFSRFGCNSPATSSTG
jgi:hypothetical protein